MIMAAERVNHPAHYNAGGIECIDALEAATIGLEGIEAFCTANAIKYLWRWKRKNGEEDLQKAIWYINRIIDRAGKPPEERKGLFDMTENKHGFEPKQEITIGGIAFTIIQTAESWVKCIASECVGEGAFDAQNRNDFAASDIREFLNGEFLHKLIAAGAPEAMFEYFNVDLTADDGLKGYGGDRVRVGLITCDEYRLLRGNIPELPNTWWWTATPDSPKNPFVRLVYSDGTLSSNLAYVGLNGVRPLCVLKSEILKSYLIPIGKENAVTRAHLRAVTGLPDRKIREEIEQARRKGAIIINAQDGAGYYQSEDIRDIAKQYRQNERRALSILAQQKHLRKRLKEAGVMEGRKVVINDDV